MTEVPLEPRTVFPLVVFNRQRLGMTAGQKEGIISEDPISVLPPDRVTDFRPKVIASDVELPEPKAPAGDDLAGKDADPKDVVSSATDSVTPSEGEPSESGGPETPSQTSPTSPSFLSEPPVLTADAEKELLAKFKEHFPPRTIGVSVLPAETTGEAPSET